MRDLEILHWDGNIGFMGLDSLEELTSDERRLVTLKFYKDKLLYDINNYAYIEGDKLPDEAQHAKHLTQDIGENGNIDRATRLLGLMHAAVIELLYPLTKTEVIEEEIDNRLWDPDVYIIELHVPVKMSRTTMHYLARLIHEWMVYRVLADWLGIVNPEAAANWAAKAQLTED